MKKIDYSYILVWAKKIRAINVSGGRCSLCGVDDPIVLEFHHVANKTKMISGLRQRRWSVIEEEIKKCKLLCSNCHTDTYVVNIIGFKIKNQLLSLKGAHECCKCGYSGKALSFHHHRDKKFNFKSFVGRKMEFDVEQIIGELDKCIVLCRNCHIKEHFDHDRFNLFKNSIYKKSVEHKECPSPVDRNEVMRLRSLGYSMNKISKTIKCSKSTVSSIVNKQ